MDIDKLKCQIEFVENNKNEMSEGKLKRKCDYLYSKCPKLFETIFSEKPSVYKKVLDDMLLGLECVHSNKCDKDTMDKLIGCKLADTYITVGRNEKKYNDLIEKSNKQFDEYVKK
jgi:hypothetical protein